jgi:hypothetical protein
MLRRPTCRITEKFHERTRKVLSNSNKRSSGYCAHVHPRATDDPFLREGSVLVGWTGLIGPQNMSGKTLALDIAETRARAFLTTWPAHLRHSS